MAPQNPRDMREYMRTLERLTTQQRAVPAMVGNAIKVVEEKIEEQKVRHPAPPVELEAQTAVYLDPTQKRTLASVIVDFPDVIFNTDGTPAHIDQYELWGRDETIERDDFDEGIWVRQGSSTTSSISVFGYLPGSEWTFRARALSAESVGAGEWSEEIVVTMLKDNTPPPQPTAPILTVARGTITVAWDGKAVSGDMPSDLTFVQVAAGPASAPTLEWTRFAPTDRLAVYAGAKYNTPMFFRFRAQDASGNFSAWSETSTAYTTPLVDVDVILSEIDAGKTKIINAQKILLESGTELDAKLKESDKALAEAEQKLTGPGGLTDRLEDAEVRLDGTVTLERAAELQSALNENKVLLDATEKKITGAGGLTERLAGVDTKLADVGGLTYAAGQTLRQKIAATDTAVSTAQGQVNTLKNTTVPKLSTDLTAATGRITTAEGKLTTAQADLATAKADIVSAKKSITDNKTIMDGAVTRLGTAEQEITASKTRLTTAEGKLSTLQGTTIPALNKDLADAETRIDSAQGLLDLIPGNITAAKQAAIDAAMADAEAKVTASLEAAKKDAQAKADAAQAAATAAAAEDATKKADAARASSMAAAEAAIVAAREAAGMAGARGRTWFQAEAPPEGTVYGWEGVQHNSYSLMKVDGLEVRRNYFPNPGAMTGTQMSGWAGNTGNVSTAVVVDAPWAKSGKAHRRTWQTVTSQTGDHSISLSSGLRGIGHDTPFTISAKVRIGGEIQRLNAVRVYSHISTLASGAYTQIDGSPQMAIMPGSTYTIWATGSAREDITSDFRMLVDPRPLADGDYIEFSDIMMYEGTYDPNREWFWGDSPDERENDLWIDTDEGNTPKRWDGTGWVAVTDQTAITAATAAAALDATTKADAAKVAAIAAASEDATKKANAAQAAAVTAADIAAKATAKSEAEAAEARAAATAAADAKDKADAAQAAALKAAKTYADAQADGAGGLALEAAKADATAKADAAQAAAIKAAALDATAKKEAAEATAAADAKTKADKALADAKADATTKADAAKTAATSAAANDATTKANKALADAKLDAQTKANAAQAAAITAADLAAKATAKAAAEAAEARVAIAAAADATTKADEAKNAALAAAKSYAEAQATGASADALAAAKADATKKADAAEAAAIIAAAAETKAKTEAAEARAAADAKTKADKALSDAKTDASTKATAAQKAAEATAAADATTKSNAAKAIALEAAAAAEAAAKRALAAAVNVALDPGAENVDAWNFPAGVRDYSIVTEEKSSGSRSLQISGKGGTAAQALWITPMNVPTKPGDIWEITAMVKTSADYNGTGNNGKIRLAGPSGELLNAWSIPITADWRKVGAEYTVPAGVNSIYVTVMSDHSKGTVWLDEFTVTNVTAVRTALAAAEQARKDAIATAATDATTKANKALSDAKADATKKADDAQAAAITAADLAAKATAKYEAEAAEARAAITAADDAKSKADAAEAAALKAAKTYADAQASGAGVLALEEAQKDATAKANAAQKAAIEAAALDATAKRELAEANAAKTAQTKADKALSDAKTDSANKAAAAQKAAIEAAAADATTKANAARDESVAAAEIAADLAREAAGLANSMGRTWFQPGEPPAGYVYDWEGNAFESPSTLHDADGELLRTNMAMYPAPAVGGWGSRTNSGTSAIGTPYRNEPAPGGNGFRRVTLTGAPSDSKLAWYRLSGRVTSDAIVPGRRYRATLAVRAGAEGLTSSIAFRWHSGAGWLNETGGSISGLGTDWKVYSFEAVAPATAIRLDFDFGGNNSDASMVGNHFDMAYIIVTEATDPSTEYFDGSTPDERDTDLWIDTDEGNTPKRWDGTVWAPVTDQAAITAATTAAAADAKKKADAALATALASIAKGGSAVINGSFEEGFTGWDMEITPNPETHGIDATVARTGTQSFWTVGKGGFRQTGFPVVPGQTWEMALWYKTDAAYSGSNAGGLRVQARVNGTWADVASSTLRMNLDWTRSAVRYTVPAGVSQIRARFAFNYSGGAKCWVDDIELLNVSTEVTAAADATAKADAALAIAQSANAETNKQLTQLAANAGNMAPYGDLESLSGTYFPLNASTARSGERAFTHRITTFDVSGFMPDIAVTPGNWYQVSFWIKADRDITVQAGMPMTWVGANGALLNQNRGTGYTLADRNGPLTTEYRQISYMVQAEPGMKAMRPRFFVQAAATTHADNGATVYMDDFVLKDVTEYRLALAATDLARLEALAAADRASDEARAAAGLANTMGRTWFQSEAPPTDHVYNWTGTPGTSVSELSKDGVVLRRNLISNPRFQNSLSTWSGGNASWKFTAVRETVPAEHREFLGSDTAMRCEWIEGGTNGPYFGYNFPEALTEATPVTFKLNTVGLSGKPEIRAMIEVFNAASARTGTQFGDFIQVMPGAQHAINLEGTLPAGTTRIVFAFYLRGNSGKDGDALLFTSALGEVGTKGDYFDGDTPDDREMDLWIDTDEGNTPKRWNGSGWTAVTDQAAITAATTAAALDATKKADAAKQAAVAAASEDATTKAEAARKAAITAAELDAKTKADNAQRIAIESAALEAQKKVDAAATATLTTAATEAQKKADKAKTDAITAAAAETLLKANGAREDAIAAAELDAKAKAAEAQRLAIEAAALHADQVAAQAKTDAVTAAANDATSKANKAKADAIDAAALDAAFKADEAERRAKADAATAQARADKAVSDAAAASGLAAGKGKVLVQSAAPGAEDRNKMTLWIDTTSGNNTPKMWTTGTTWVAVTDKKATDAASAAATAKSAADAAAAAAVTAQSRADSAMSAAGSLNQVYYSTKDPSGIAPVGSTWRKQDSAKNIIGEWQYVGGTTPWQAQLVTSQAISNLDLGKLSVGTAAMDTAVVKKLVAETASFQTVDAKNIFVTGTASLSEVVAKRLAAETGTFMTITTNQLTAGSADLGTAVAQKIAAATATFQKADISNLTAGTANMTQAVIEKLVANTANFQTVKVDNITATSTANLNSVVAQRIAAGTASFQTVDAKNLFVTGTASLDTAVAKRFAAETGTFLELGVDQLVVSGNAKLKTATAERLFADIFTAKKITTNEMMIGSFANLLENPSFELGYTGWDKTTSWTAEATGGRMLPGAMKVSGIVERTFGPTSNRIPVDTNDTYRLSGWVRTNATTNPTQGEICWYWYRADGSFIGNNNMNIKDASGAWQYYDEQRKPPAEAAFLAIRINATLGHVAQEYWFDDLGVALATDGSLIVQNSITAREIDAQKVAAAIGSFVKADIGNLVVSGSTNLNSVTADRIFTNLFSTRKLYTESLIIGQMGNAIPDPLFTDPEYVRRVNAYSTCTVALSADNDLAITGTASTTYFRPLGVPQTPAGSKDWIPVKPGQKWRFDVTMSVVKVTGGYITIIGRNVDGTVYTNPPTSARTPIPVGSGALSIEVEVPANCYWIMPEMAVPANSGTFWVKRGSMVVREMITPELVVEGGITAKHILASEEMSAKVGKFLKVELTDLVSTGTASLNTAVVDKLFAETFATRKLTANQVYIGEGGNIFPADLTDSGWQSLNGITFHATGGQGGGSSMLVPASTSQVGTYFGISGTAHRLKMPKLVQGGKYRIRANFKSETGLVPKAGVSIYFRLYGETGSAYTWASPSAIGNGEQVAKDTWGLVDGIFTVPEDSANLYLALGVYANAAHTGNARFSDITVQEAITPELIVDGAVTTKKLTVTEDMTVALLKAHKVQASEIAVNTLAADTAFVGAMEAKLIVSDVFSGKTFTGGTFNGGVFQSTPTANLGVRMDSSGFQAFNAAKQRTVFIDAATGEMSATGSFETSKLGGVYITLDTNYDDDGKRIRPKLAFRSSALKAEASPPAIFTEFDQAGMTPNFGHGSIVVQGASLEGRGGQGTVGSSLNWGYFYINGNGRAGGMVLRGTGVEGIGIDAFEDTLHIRGKIPKGGGGYNNSMFRTGEVGALTGPLGVDQVVEYTIAVVPATGARLHPFVSVDATNTAFTTTVYNVLNSSFKVRLWNVGKTASNVSGIHYFCSVSDTI